MTVPANGAVRESSIFIASSTPSDVALVDLLALATLTASTVPGIGAVTVPSPAIACRAGEDVGPR